MSTAEIFRRYNFHFFNEILDKDFGVIYCHSIIDPRKKVFQKPFKKRKNE